MALAEQELLSNVDLYRSGLPWQEEINIIFTTKMWPGSHRKERLDFVPKRHDLWLEAILPPEHMGTHFKNTNLYLDSFVTSGLPNWRSLLKRWLWRRRVTIRDRHTFLQYFRNCIYSHVYVLSLETLQPATYNGSVNLCIWTRDKAKCYCGLCKCDRFPAEKLLVSEMVQTFPVHSSVCILYRGSQT